MPLNNQQKNKSTDTSTSSFPYEIRIKNPLTALSSWTYNLSLYILDPIALNVYAENNMGLPKKNNKNLYWLIAQSGGINQNLETRAMSFNNNGSPGGEGYDFYIDNCYISQNFAPGEQNTSTAINQVNFKIIEPQGFTFLSRLKKLTEYININNQYDFDKIPTLFQHHYMLVIRFYGYDSDGRPFTRNQVQLPSQDLAYQSENEYALFERYFAIKPNKVDWSISGKSVTYNWECVHTANDSPYNTVFGLIQENMNLKGSTIGDVLQGNVNGKNPKSLLNQLNDREQKLKNDGAKKSVTTYKISFPFEDNLKNVNFRKIKNSKLNYSSANVPMSTANNSKESNVRTQLRTVTIDVNSQEINISAGTSIPMAIDQIITYSSYISDVLLKKNNDVIENSIENNPNLQKLSWYYINPVVTEPQWDSKNGHFNYTIDYQIIPYDISFIRSAYVDRNKLQPYYGPVKEYNYYFTGENTEILKHDQTYNNSFFLNVSTSSAVDADGSTNVPASDPVPIHYTGSANSNSTQSGPNSKGQPNQNVRADFYDPSLLSPAEIRIVGDPDFLMDGIGVKYRESETFKQFHSQNLSINPYGGCIYIQIIFKLAEDYKENGLLDVTKDNELQFYPTSDPALGNEKGWIYLVTGCESTFSQGKFEQKLSLNWIPPGWFEPNNTTANFANASASNQNSTNQREPEKNNNSTPQIRVGNYSRNGAIAGGNTAPVPPPPGRKPEIATPVKPDPIYNQPRRGGGETFRRINQGIQARKNPNTSPDDDNDPTIVSDGVGEQ